MQNYGAVPPRTGVTLAESRGFNLLLFSSGNRPTHFAKCRPGSHPQLVRESELLVRLRADAGARAHVPHVVVEAAPDLTVQLAGYESGALLIHRLEHADPPALLRETGEILAIVRNLAQRADGDGFGEPVCVRRSADGLLPVMISAGLEADRAARLEAALAAGGTVRGWSQHGDLWPANVLRGPAGWVILDFEHFGLTRIPMVDAVQLVRGCVEIRWPEPDRDWIAGLALASPGSRFCRGALASARADAGLDDAQAVGALAFALIEITARFVLAGRASPAWRSSLSAARSLADALAEPAGAARMLFGGG